MSPARGKPAPTLRSRLVASFVAVALGALIVAGGVTLGFARANAREAARDDLRDQAAALTPVLADIPLDRVRGLLPVLRVQEAALVRVGRLGVVVPPLPEGLDEEDLDVERLQGGESVSGGAGSLVYIAQPFDPARPPRDQRGRPGPPEAGATHVLVLTREVAGIDLGGLGPWLLTAGGVALVAAGAIGALLARRLTRPLAATQRAARAIAGGDLSARVGAAGRSDRELAEVAQAFDEMAEELEHSRSLARDFLMSVSHDLRTPLTSIRGYAEALSEGAVRRQDDRRRAAAVIESEARRLERLVSDLLDLARLDARRFTLDPRPTDPAAVVSSVAAGFAPVADELGVTLAVVAPPAGPREVDPERLGQIVANLVENALKYAETRVDVATSEADGAFVVEIADDGPGIADDELDRVFERLYTSRPAGGRKVGTGLGLAIVHELATAMGGTVGAESGDGEGARFRLTLS